MRHGDVTKLSHNTCEVATLRPHDIRLSRGFAFVDGRSATGFSSNSKAATKPDVLFESRDKTGRVINCRPFWKQERAGIFPHSE